MGLYARHTGTKIHIFHLSSRDGLDMIDEWRAKGVDITTETGAHYVFKKAEDMDQTGVRLRMNPPVRWGSRGPRRLPAAGPHATAASARSRPTIRRTLRKRS